MYPATIFNWHDQSQISTETTSAEIDDSPLLMQVFSSDKGTEDLIEINDDDFDAMYGTMSFQKHGQSAIQAKAIVKAGGRLLAKRVVADDATLANVILCAHIVEAVPAEVDPETGAITKAGSIKVKWVATTATGCKSFADVKAAAKKSVEFAERWDNSDNPDETVRRRKSPKTGLSATVPLKRDQRKEKKGPKKNSGN